MFTKNFAHCCFSIKIELFAVFEPAFKDLLYIFIRSRWNLGQGASDGLEKSLFKVTE